MKLQFHQPFGHHRPGEVVEVPDEAEYDRSYLKPADPDAEAPAEEKPEVQAAPLYPPKGDA